VAPPPDPEDQLRAYAHELAAGVDRALPGWVTGAVERIMTAWAGSVPDNVRAEAAGAAARARTEVGTAVRDLLETDIDSQTTTPLALVRGAVCYPTEVLRAAGVPPLERDPFDERAFPEDIYGLTPASFADLDPQLAEAGLAWGAAKAFVHKRRHRTA
jgi:hypothetical protein